MVRNASEEADSSDSSSLGLGLHIAREIVHAHGGTLIVKSTEREGTTFTARIPRFAEPRVVQDDRVHVEEGAPASASDQV